MGRPAKEGSTSRYMQKKLEAQGDYVPENQSGKKHRITDSKHAPPEVRAARAAADNVDGSPFIKKMVKLYADQLESGIEGVSCKCHYQGLTGLARSFHKPHPEIEALMFKNELSLLRYEKNAIAAYGYEVLMGNV